MKEKILMLILISMLVLVSFQQINAETITLNDDKPDLKAGSWYSWNWNLIYPDISFSVVNVGSDIEFQEKTVVKVAVLVDEEVHPIEVIEIELENKIWKNDEEIKVSSILHYFPNDYEEHLLTIVVDYSNEVDESNEDNNDDRSFTLKDPQGTITIMFMMDEVVGLDVFITGVDNDNEINKTVTEQHQEMEISDIPFGTYDVEIKYNKLTLRKYKSISLDSYNREEYIITGVHPKPKMKSMNFLQQIFENNYLLQILQQFLKI